MKMKPVDHCGITCLPASLILRISGPLDYCFFGE